MSLALLLLACGLSTQPPAYTGTVEVTEVDVSTVVPGRLLAVHPGWGDRVSAGDPLFEVDAAALEVQRDLRLAQIDQAQAAVDAATAQVSAVDAQVHFLRGEVARVKDLEAAGVGTDQQVATLEGQLRVARAQASAARELVAQASAGRGQAEAGLAAAELQLDESHVDAPVSGVVLSRNREPGEVVGLGMSVLTLGDLDHPRLRVYLPLKRVEAVSLGDTVPVFLDVAPDQPVTGEVVWIASESEFTPRDILTPDERVKRVFAVDVALPAGSAHPGVPAEARF